MSIRRLSLGAGYEYLLRSVARGDGAAHASSPLTRYYAESGTPPGRFLGAGLSGLGGGGVPAGTLVSEDALFRMLGMLADPVTGEPLGRPPTTWPTSVTERIRQRVEALGQDLGDDERAGAIARIEQEEHERHVTRPVAGFDLTFSVPKSVSAVWAIADAPTQAEIYQAHQDAIAFVIAWAERNVFCSRSGHGGAVEEDIVGVVAAAFDHWDSRAGDPHLHTHVVVANRAQSTRDGAWRSLDSRTLFRYTVALSEMHEGVLEDLLTDRFGYGWDERSRAHSLVPRHDVAGVPDALMEEFSQRSGQIEITTAQLIARFAATRSRQPDAAEILRLRQQATLATRPDKQHAALAEQTRRWRVRARPFVGDDTATWADTLREQCVLPALTAEPLDGELLVLAARAVLDAVAHKRSTFGQGNVLAETHRQLHGVRFCTPADRVAVAERITSAALDQAICLEREIDLGVAGRGRRSAARYTTATILDAEERLLEAGRDTSGPTARVADLLTTAAVELGADQDAAVRSITGSGRVLDVLVGPAGSGKTTCLAALRGVWEDEHGEGSVIGLAPSAVAAEVLATELGIDTENTAKWLHEQARQRERQARIDALLDRLPTISSPSTVAGRRLWTQLRAAQAEHDRWNIQPGQLVLLDEASLAGTRALDAIVARANTAGAKVVLVGDPFQLSAIEAGGAFAMLVKDRDDAPELTGIRRFRNEWEADASLALRAGEPRAIAAYEAHDRIRSGSRDEMLDQLYRAWRTDSIGGITSLMIADDTESVAALNLRARAERVAAGEVSEQCVEIAAGGVAGVGDHVVTRQNNRRFDTGRSWVKNGDQWTVTALGGDGSLRVKRARGVGEITLPASYVEHHVELGYAATAHRAQGRTVDTTHALVDDRTSREVLYVAATRGRESNVLYVDTTGEEHLQATDATLVLRGALERVTVQAAATSMARPWSDLDTWAVDTRPASESLGQPAIPSVVQF